MNVTLRREPCMLYETVELLYAWVNGIPPEQLTLTGPYCIPKEDVARMLEAACGGVDAQSPVLRHFFARQMIEDETNQETCLAFYMVYWSMNLSIPDIPGQMAAICSAWERIRRRPFTIRAINRLALDIEELSTGQPVLLGTELRKLPVSESFFLSLLETFSDYTYHMGVLRDILLPVSRRLRPLLEPLIVTAGPLRESWEAFFRETSLEDFVTRRTEAAPEMQKPFDQACICLRYLQPRYTPIQVDHNSFWMHLSVGVQPASQQTSTQVGLSDQELAALRLLGDKGRSDMIRALMGRPMSMQELANRLNLNPGTVFRNLNSLTNTGLTTKEVWGDRYYYRANFQLIQSIFQNVLSFYESGSQSEP